MSLRVAGGVALNARYPASFLDIAKTLTERKVPTPGGGLANGNPN